MPPTAARIGRIVPSPIRQPGAGEPTPDALPGVPAPSSQSAADPPPRPGEAATAHGQGRVRDPRAPLSAAR